MAKQIKKVNVYISPLAPASQVPVPNEVEVKVEVKEGEKPKTKTVKLERSVEGALHFRPGGTKVISEDELAYIKKNNKQFAKFIVSANPVKEKSKKKSDGPTLLSKMAKKGAKDKGSGKGDDNDPPSVDGKDGKGKGGKK